MFLTRLCHLAQDVFAMKTPRIKVDHTSLSEVEIQVLRAFRDHIGQHQVPPTFEEAADAVKRSKSTVRHIIARLVKKGMLAKAETKSLYRNIFLTNLGLIASNKRIAKKGVK
jgi:DNA-binding MarR family transcriptional regulator